MTALPGSAALGAVLLALCALASPAPVFTPYSYDVSVTVSSSQEFSGSLTLVLNVDHYTEGYRNITLEAEDIFLKSLTVEDDKQNKLEIVKIYRTQTELNILLYVKNNTISYKVTMTYTGRVYQDEQGIYITKDGQVIGTDLYPTATRRVFPCITDPAYKVPVTFKSSQTIIKGKPVFESEDISNEMVPLYHAGFLKILSNYKKNSDSIQIWYPNDYTDTNAVTYITKWINNQFYSQIFTTTNAPNFVIVYGLKPLSSAAHQIVSLRSDAMSTGSSESLKGTLMVVYNALNKYLLRHYATPSSWREFWLTDSVALFLQYKLGQPALVNNAQIIKGGLSTEIVRLGLQDSSAQIVQASNFKPENLILEQLYPAVYKGASLLCMWDDFVYVAKQKSIEDDIVAYIESNSSARNSTELLDTFGDGSFKGILPNKNVFSMLAVEWLTLPDYPLLTMDLYGSQFNLRQEAYSSGYTQWAVPFTYLDTSSVKKVNTPEKDTKENWLLGSASFDVNATQGYYVDLNPDALGLYRVKYSERTWSRLDNLTILKDWDKAAKLDDVFSMAWSDKPVISLDLALDVIDSLTPSDGFYTWSLALSHFDNIMLLYYDTLYRDPLQEKLTRNLYQTYNYYNLNKNMWTSIKEPAENIDGLFYKLIVSYACKFRVSTCNIDAAGKDLNNVNPDLKSFVNCAQMTNLTSEKDVDTWKNKFKTLYTQNKDSVDTPQYERSGALFALACPKTFVPSGNPCIKEYLSRILVNNSLYVLPSDVPIAFSHIISKPEHINQSLYFMVYNYQTIVQSNGDEFFLNRLREISPKLSTYYHMKLLNLFTDFYSLDEETKKAAEDSKALLERNLARVTRESVVLGRWLGVAPLPGPTGPTGSVPTGPTGPTVPTPSTTPKTGTASSSLPSLALLSAGALILTTNII